MFSTGFASGFYIGQDWSNTVLNNLLYKKYYYYLNETYFILPDFTFYLLSMGE